MDECEKYNNCWDKLYEYVKAIYEKLNYGYIHDLHNEHNELKERIGNVLLTLGNRLGINQQLKAEFKTLEWKEEFRYP